MMLYNRAWFHNDLYAITSGGGFMNNPGRYLALTPPINGATAATGSPYFTQQPGQKLFQWDTQLNFQSCPQTGSPGGRRRRFATPTCRTGREQAV